ncbi:MAG: amidohydrolase family protein [Acidimicrobiales bacterium]
MRPLHVAGVVLPEEAQRDIYIVGDRLTYDPVTGAETIADRGFVLPGLVDAHCHIGIGRDSRPVESVAAAKDLALEDRHAGVLAIRDAGSPIDYRTLDDDPDVPRLIRCGRHLAPPRRYLPGLAIECTPDELAGRVLEQAAAGTGWVKLVGDWIDRDIGDIGPTFDAAAVNQAVETAHGAGVRVAVHTFGEAAVEALVDAKVDSIEHGCGLDAGLLDRMAAQGTALVPTMVNVEWNFESIAAQAEARFPRFAASMRSAKDRFRDVVRAAFEAGVAIYTGSDAGGAVPHGRLVDEILLLHHAGLPATEAVAAGSWRAREWLGLASLAEGGPADLAVYDADPRLDPRVLSDPRRIVLRGAVVR